MIKNKDLYIITNLDTCTYVKRDLKGGAYLEHEAKTFSITQNDTYEFRGQGRND